MSIWKQSNEAKDEEKKNHPVNFHYVPFLSDTVDRGVCVCVRATYFSINILIFARANGMSEKLFWPLSIYYSLSGPQVRVFTQQQL